MTAIVNRAGGGNGRIENEMPEIGELSGRRVIKEENIVGDVKTKRVMLICLLALFAPAVIAGAAGAVYVPSLILAHVLFHGTPIDSVNNPGHDSVSEFVTNPARVLPLVILIEGGLVYMVIKSIEALKTSCQGRYRLLEENRVVDL